MADSSENEPKKPGHRSGGIDFDAEQVNITGDVAGRDVNKYYNFSGSYASLSEYYIPPDSVFQRVKVEDFVGRKWLDAKVDAYLEDPSRKSGVLQLIGEAGVGKTAFMVHLVRERGYMHLFAEQVPGEAMVVRAMQSLGAQLVTRYQIDSYKQKDTLSALSGFPDFLDRVLRLAVANLKVGEKIVIVCDALDEAGVAQNGNVFGLPKVLPDGVYLILSHRPVNVQLHFDIPPQVERLIPEGEENQHDVRTFLQVVAQRPKIREQLQARGYSEAQFVQTLAEKSAGVWMYLYYVIDEIARGSRARLDLDKLPPGVAGYYAEYWSAWRDGHRGRGEEQWGELYAPLLATLAAIQEPVDVEHLIAWAAIKASPFEVERLLSEDWRAFITVREEEGETLYRLYHASLQDFITGKIESGSLPSASGLIKELVKRTRKAHKSIVEHYRAQCNGDWPKQVGDNYARTYLTTHLSGSGQYDEMFSLVAQSNVWAKARYEKEGDYRGHLSDLDLAWQWAESDNNWSFGRQIRCALIKTSIQSLASNISPELLYILLETGLWSPARALTLVSQMPDERKQAESLSKIAPILPNELKREALDAARKIEDDRSRAQVLCELAAHLTDELKYEALNMAREIRDDTWRADALSGLAAHLPETLMELALVAVCEIGDDWSRARALSIITRNLSQELKRDALAAARGIRDDRSRAYALSRLAQYLPNPLRDDAVHEALNMMNVIGDEWWHADTLIELVPYLSDKVKDQAVRKALETVLKTEENWSLPGTLLRMAKRLSDADTLKGEILLQALKTTRAFAVERSRTEWLVVLAQHLPDNLKREALDAANEIGDEQSRVSALSEMAAHLPKNLRDQVLNKALLVARGIEKESSRSNALTRLALCLSNELKSEVTLESLATARKIKDADTRARALSNLAAHLPKDLVLIAAQEALDAARGVTDVEWRITVLQSMAQELPDIGVLKTEIVGEIISAADGIRDYRAHASALSGLAAHLPEELRHEALTDVCGIIDELSRADALGQLMAHLPNELRYEVLTATRKITDDRSRARALSRILQHLPDSLRDEVVGEILAVTRKIIDDRSRVTVLNKLVAQLPEGLTHQSHSEILTVVNEIKSDGARARVLSTLTVRLPKELKRKALSDALATAERITDGGLRVDVLSELVVHLPMDLKNKVLSDALAIARKIEDDRSRAIVLAKLALHLPEKLKGKTQSDALAVARNIEDDERRADTLNNLITHLPEELKSQAVGDALAAAEQITDSGSRVDVLSELAVHLPKELQVHILHKGLREVQNVVGLNSFTLGVLSSPLKNLSWPGIRSVSLGGVGGGLGFKPYEHVHSIHAIVFYRIWLFLHR